MLVLLPCGSSDWLKFNDCLGRCKDNGCKAGPFDGCATATRNPFVSVIPQEFNMVRTLARHFSALCRPLVAQTQPSQLALAISLGIAIGLVPKLNLIAITWLGILFVSRANLLVGLATATLATVGGLMIDPYLHRFGDVLLTTHWCQPPFAAIYALPFGPWTSINNTVVAAATVLGLLQLIPTYFLARAFFARRFDQLQDHWFTKAIRTEATTGWRL